MEEGQVEVMKRVMGMGGELELREDKERLLKICRDVMSRKKSDPTDVNRELVMRMLKEKE